MKEKTPEMNLGCIKVNQPTFSNNTLIIVLHQQVLHFVVSHSDVFTTIMREQHTTLKLEALEELALTTSVVGTVTADSKFMKNGMFVLAESSHW